MFTKAIASGAFSGVSLGFSDIRISHLQFSDDLIFFSDDILNSLKDIKRILRLFEVVSGLKLNMTKSKLYGFCMDKGTLGEWVDQVKCDWDHFLTTYLGLPLEQNRNSSEMWKPMVEKVRSRLKG
ncbi:hypothetical protein F3Y22_tig00000765pilonHSYRG00039 [Hibiscus syriacus]|uniref:Reverse transcriptase domain-containing protein n=1 Tax=Hibiscus syriacus TaxID=106335 RepID=A0A6A3CYB3_HIBSY|nr:hypothetical protein F3Y22_tig00000765pilonHSYRG00039 [Hibiscus syriacus]